MADSASGAPGFRTTGGRRIRAWIPLAAAVWAAGCMPFVQRDTSRRVLVLNMHAGTDAAGAANLDGVAALIRETDADVVLLQEVDRGTKRSGGVDQLQALMDATGYEGVFGRTLDYDGGEYGIAALAREGFGTSLTLPLPVVPSQPRAGGSHEPRGVLIATAKTREGRLPVFNTHLDASGPDTYRRQEIEELLVLVRVRAPSGAAAIVGGDFNAEPGSPVIARMLSGGFRDAWAECGSGDGLTYPAGQPVKRIDYLFLTGPLSCREARVIDSRVSDHRPLLVTLDGTAER